jgi:hypothetical protein
MGALFLHFATTDVHRLIIAGTAAVRVSHAPHVNPSPVKTSIEHRGAGSGYTCATRYPKSCQDFDRAAGGSGYHCATRKSNFGKAVTQWRSFWPAHFCALFLFAESGVIRLIVVIATAVLMSQAPRA